MKFLITFTSTSLLIMLLFTGLIYSVDPYEKFGINFWNFKTKAVAQSRENKFRILEKSSKHYEAFILGSSAAHRYPTEKLEGLTGYKTFNYAVQHSTPLDYLAITRHILSKHSPKLILLQLDFAALDENYHIDNRIYNSPLKDFLTNKTNQDSRIFDNDYFTLKALSDSLRVFQVNYFGKARHIYAEDGNYIYEKITPHKIKLKQSSSDNYVFSEKRLQLLKEIQKLAVQKGFKFIIISSPISYNHLEAINQDPRMKQAHELFLSKLKESFPNFINFQDQELKNYFHFKYFLDSIHPTKEMSEIVLEKIFKKS